MKKNFFFFLLSFRSRGKITGGLGDAGEAWAAAVNSHASGDDNNKIRNFFILLLSSSLARENHRRPGRGWGSLGGGLGEAWKGWGGALLAATVPSLSALSCTAPCCSKLL